MGLFFGSIRKIVYKVKKDTGVNISQQTIENFDSKQNIIVADEIYYRENSKNIREFLEQSTMNKNKIAITSDLNDKYKPIIERLWFKHQ